MQKQEVTREEVPEASLLDGLRNFAIGLILLGMTVSIGQIVNAEFLTDSTVSGDLNATYAINQSQEANETLIGKVPLIALVVVMFLVLGVVLRSANGTA